MLWSNYPVDACFLASRYFQLKDLLSQYDLVYDSLRGLQFTF